MIKYFALVVAILAMSILAFGQHAYNGTLSDAPSGGWGHDCSTWTSTGGVGYNLTSACLTTEGTFVDCATHIPVVWPGLDIQVWVEAMCWFSWEETAYQVHVANTETAQDICFVFSGTNSCNIPVNINTEGPGTAGDVGVIPWVSGIGGWNNGSLGGNLEATWQYQYTTGNGPLNPNGWLPYTGQTGHTRTFQVPECQHSVYIQCCLHFDVHQKAGYYHLAGGSICPANPA